MKTKKSWSEKLQGAHPAKVVDIPPRMRKQWGKGKMLIPTPLDVDAAIRKVPRGKVVTLTDLRNQLAKAAGADVTCPMCAGIFVRIVAEAAEEKVREGKTRVTPYWRVVKEGGKLLEKIPGGPMAQAAHLADEGHKVDTSAKLRLIS
jgi:alkylated DNA nucleotide flippase Atl1